MGLVTLGRFGTLDFIDLFPPKDCLCLLCHLSYKEITIEQNTGIRPYEVAVQASSQTDELIFLIRLAFLLDKLCHGSPV